MFKIVKWAVLVVVGVVVIGGIALYLNLNRIVRTAVQNGSTQSLKLETTLGSANLSLFGGSLDLNNLQIASPQGFSNDTKLLSLDQAALKVNYGQLRSEPIRVSQITLSKPVLVLEQVGGKLNIKAAMDQMPKSDAEPMRLVIDTLTVSDASVVVRPNVPGMDKQITVPVPTITLKNIGTDGSAQNGAAIKDVAMQVMTAMVAKAADSDKMPPQVKALLNLNVEQLGQQLGAQVTEQIGKLTGDLGKKLGEDPNKVLQDPGKALQDGLGGLLKKDDKKASGGK
jgi:hypothetical protein